MKRLDVKVHVAIMRRTAIGLVLALSLAACTTTTTPVPQRNGFIATLTGDLKADLSSGEMLYANTTEIEGDFFIDTDSYDLETGLEYSVAFAFSGTAKAGDYQVAKLGAATPQAVSVQLTTCTIDACSENWESMNEGTVTLSEVSDTNIVGAFDLPLALGEQKAVLKGTFYLLPLPSDPPFK